MQLWTYHPTAFRVDNAGLVIDHTKGQYWRCAEPGFRYRDVLPKLQELLGTRQFLWCYTVRGLCKRWTEDMDLVEWELNVPQSRILRFIRSYVWEDIVRSKRDDWNELFITNRPEAGEDVHALVSVPLLTKWIRCHGQLRPEISREAEEVARQLLASPRDMDSKLREEYELP